MKNLIYKEMKLSIHPLCYVFSIVFPLVVIAPDYPVFISSLFIVSMFAILFLGPNKGMPSNDLFYTAVLPIRKKDIVIARLFSLMFLEVVTLAFILAFFPIRVIVQNAVRPNSALTYLNSGILSSVGFVLVGYAIINAFFILMFYHKCKSIVAPLLIGVICYALFVSFFTMILPIVSPTYANILTNQNVWIQLIFLFVGVVIFAISNCLIAIKGGKELDKVDL